MILDKINNLANELTNQMALFGCCAYNRQTLELVDVRHLSMIDGKLTSDLRIPTDNIVYIKQNELEKLINQNA